MPKSLVAATTTMLAVAALAASGDAPAATITEYLVPSVTNTGPSDVCRGPDHALWFPESSGGGIGRLDLATHEITSYLVPGSVMPSGCDPGPGHSHTVVFSDLGLAANSISTINVHSHVINTYQIPTPGARPVDVVSGPDGAVWFTEMAPGKIGRLDLETGSITEFTIPRDFPPPVGDSLVALQNFLGGFFPEISDFSSPFPFDIAKFGGKIWFGQMGANRIGSIDPYTHVITNYNLPSGLILAGVLNVETPEDGGIWFTEIFKNQIGRFDPVSGDFREFEIPTAGSLPFTLHGGPRTDRDGVYFVEAIANKIGRVDIVSGEVTEYPLPRAGSVPADLYADFTLDSVYFAELGGNAIGRLTPNKGPR